MTLAEFSTVQLLTLLIAGEADGEELAGQVAVACVPVERLRRGRWGATLREVMLQPYQFSTFNDGHWERFIPRIDFQRRLARLAMEKLLNTPTPGATHYHAERMTPSWAHSSRMMRIGQLGRHVFYRED